VGSAQAYVCLLAVLAAMPAGQAKLWSLFTWTWLLAPAAGIGFAGLCRAAQRRWWPGHPGFYPLLLIAAHAACVLALLPPLRINDPAWPLDTLVLALGSYAAALGGLRLFPAELAAGARALWAVALASGMLAAAAAGFVFAGQAQFTPAQAAAIAAAGALLAWWATRPAAPEATPWGAADWLAAAGLLWLLLPWHFQPDLHHEGFYLGPANDLLHGRSMLVDTSCQYGVGVVYFLAGLSTLLRLPLSFDGLFCLDSLLYLVAYLAAYALLRRLLRSRLLAVLAVAVAVVVERFPAHWQDIAQFPSVGPLRFGLPLLLLLAAWRRRRRSTLGLRPRLLEGLLLGLTSLWSLETLVYALAGYGAFCAGEAWMDRPRPHAAAVALGRSLAFGAAAVALAQVLFMLATRAWAGAWPHWGLYWDFLSLYSGGFGSLDFPLHAPWVLPQGICLASLLACLLLLFKGRDRSAELLLVLGLTMASVAEFTYFIGRAHLANLGHLAFPPAMLAFYWLDRLARSRGVPRAAAMGLLFAGGAVTAALSMNLQGALQAARGAEQAWIRPGGVWDTVADLSSRLEHPAPYNPAAAEAAALTKMFLPGRGRVVLLVPDQATVEAHLLSGTCDLSQISDPNEDALVPLRRLDIHVDDALQAGDIIVAGPFDRPLEPRNSTFAWMQELRLRLLQRRFAFQALAHGPWGVYAVRLLARPPR
jgi:hypothetical protein